MSLTSIKFAAVLDEADLVVLAGSRDTEVGQVIFKLVEIMRDRGREVNEQRPKISDNDLRKDFRTICGEVNMCNVILDLPRAAQSVLTKGEKK